MTKHPRFEKDGDHVRQGDLLVVFREKMPAKEFGRDDIGLVKQPGGVVHEGEKTGHKHEFRATGQELVQLYGFGKVSERGLPQEMVQTIRNEELAPRYQFTEKIIEVTGAMAELVHPEHETIALPRGIYEVVRQREHNEVGRPAMVED